MAKAVRKIEPEDHIAQVEVENPLWSRDHHGRKDNPRYIIGSVNLRESAIVELFAKKALDGAQYEAAERFCRLFETVGGKGARAIDYTREFVDGGRFPDPIGDAQIDAGKKLAAAYEHLTKQHGLYAWRLVSYVCGEGRSIRELTETRRQRDTMADNLRLYLDCLCVHWNLGTKGIDTCARKSENQASSEKCK